MFSHKGRNPQIRQQEEIHWNITSNNVTQPRNHERKWSKRAVAKGSSLKQNYWAEENLSGFVVSWCC